MWTCDITHPRTTGKGTSLKFHVCTDPSSRHALGWYLSTSETAAGARHLPTLARDVW